MISPRRPLAGCVVGLSISESEDSTGCGFPRGQINRVTVQMVASLFGQGVGVVFGHDWREDGVMEAVYAFARQMQSADLRSGTDAPLLQNLLPWPDQPMLPAPDRERLASALRIEQAGLPEELSRFAGDAVEAARGRPEYDYLRARALTHLRHRLDARSHARICVGGPRRRFQGRYPGIVEEALLTVRSGKALYLTGLLGGATRQVIDAVEGAPAPGDFCAPSRITQLYMNPPPEVLERSTETLRDREIAPERVWAEFQRAGVQELARANGLTVEQNLELFHTPSLDHAVRLVLAGLSAVRRTG